MVFAHFVDDTDHDPFSKYDVTIFDVAHTCKHWLQVVLAIWYGSAGLGSSTNDVRVDRILWKMDIQSLGWAKRQCLGARAFERRMAELYGEQEWKATKDRAERTLSSSEVKV